MSRRKTVQEKIADIKINPYYDATLKDTLDILQLDKPYEMFHIAFRYGYLQGGKAAKKERT